MCRLLIVTRNSYYALCSQTEVGPRAQENVKLSEDIQLIFFAHKFRLRGRYYLHPHTGRLVVFIAG